MSAPVTVLEDGKPVQIALPGGGFVEVGDPWCLLCEALDPKQWRFTEEQAALIRWLICDDCVDLIHMQLGMTTSHPAIAHIFVGDVHT